MKIYIAGPYTGDQAANVRAAIDAADRLLEAGHAPYVPHLCHFWDMVHPRSPLTWMGLVLHWLPVCEMLLRLPGESRGADVEVREAQRLGIPVFFGSVEEFLGWAK